MTFTELTLPGVFLIDSNPVADERGNFARIFCRDEFAGKGLRAEFVQCGVAHSNSVGTLRGLHYQRDPYWEEKLVRCIAGMIFDVIVDLRTASPTHRQWVGIPLTAQSSRSIYVPKGCAHGYLTLADHCDVAYHLSQPYRPEYGTGVRWNDPAFEIDGPAPVRVIAVRDERFPNYSR